MLVCKMCFWRCAINVLVSGILIFSAVSCRSKDKAGQKETGRISLASPEGGTLRQADLFEVEKIIPLETNANCLVGYVASSVARPSGFYIKTNGQVIKFDGEGKFVYNISGHGRAPEEFLELNAISVDADDRFLYVYDGGGMKVICYDAQSGEYVRHTDLDYKPLTFAVMPGGKHFVFYCGFPPAKSLEKEGRYSRFIISDTAGRVEKAFAYCHVKVTIPNMFSGTDVFAVGDSSFYCFANYNDTIFSIDKDLNVNSAFVLDYGNGNQVKQDELVRKMEVTGRGERASDMEGDGIAVLSRFCFTGGHWCFMSLRDDVYSFYLYDKANGRVVDLSMLEDDREELMGMMNAYSDYFYTVLPAIGLKEGGTEHSYGPELTEMVEKLDEDANPVILVLKAKKR